MHSAELMEVFIEDFKDNLIAFNESLMLLENGTRSADIINNIFRVAHTLKGNSSSMEFYNIERTMHAMEDVLQNIRAGKQELTDEVLKVLFECHDFLEDCIDVILQESSDASLASESLLNDIKALLPADLVKKSKDSSPAPEEHTCEELNFDEWNVDPDIWDIVAVHCERGRKLYRLEVEFAEDCLMLSVRAWMVFQSIESQAILVWSYPEKPSEEEFKQDDYDFPARGIKALVLIDSEPTQLQRAIQTCAEIVQTRIYHISLQQIHEQQAKYAHIKDVFDSIHRLEISLLDVEKKETDRGALQYIISGLDKLAESAPSNVDKLAAKLSLTLHHILDSGRQVRSEDVENIAYLLHAMLQGAKSSVSEDLEDLEESIQEHLEALEPNYPAPPLKTGELLQKKGLLTEQDVEEILEKQKTDESGLKFGQIAIREKKISAVDMLKTLQEQKTEVQEHPGKKQETAFVRVPVEKVDSLIDMLGELLILNAQLEQQAELQNEDNRMQNFLSRTVKLIKNIQSLSMSLRMVEIKPTLHRLTRIARDTGNELDKKVNVSIEGEGTEIDRSAAEKLFDPLMHLVRNAVSHGIEDAEERIAKGKKTEGQVSIRAYSKRGNVYIEVADDGQGLDVQKILKKARSLNIAEEGHDYTDEEIIKFIFKPGFSTQEDINSISGRGVGMNVVEAEISRMGGRVDIVNDVGHGCTFVLRIPLNLAVVNGTVIKVADGRYIIPTLFIKEFFVAGDTDWIDIQGHKRAVRIRDNIIPILWPEQVFAKSEHEDAGMRRELVVLEMEQRFLAFPVDKILSRQEIVSKPLGNEFSSIGYAAGASILGDGMVSLILDVEAMFRMAGL
ncbi:MAG: chemotaxis protein CheW [Acidobacteriota bacterium]